MGGSAKDMELFQDIDSGSELEGEGSDDDDDSEVEKVEKVKAVKAAVVKKEKKKAAKKSDLAEEEVRNPFLLTWNIARTLGEEDCRYYSRIYLPTRLLFSLYKIARIEE